jgi:4-hydroxythreonine-4-phosphate dehydrogenase
MEGESFLHSEKCLNVYDLNMDLPLSYQPGKPNKASALLAIASINKAIEMAKNGNSGAMVTNPVSKESIVQAGLKSFSGHTEFLAEAFHCKRFNMAFVGKDSMVALATTHIPLKEVSHRITTASIRTTLENLIAEVPKVLGEKARIALLGVNPHAGEKGLIGKEESTILLPVIRIFQKKGYSVEGPFAADSFWSRTWKTGRFNTVVAMYHDQGLIPVKNGLIGSTANVTLGLPYIRTSVDHGTGFDIAGKGIADPTGLETAILCAKKMMKVKYGT